MAWDATGRPGSGGDGSGLPSPLRASWAQRFLERRRRPSDPGGLPEFTISRPDVERTARLGATGRGPEVPGPADRTDPPGLTHSRTTDDEDLHGPYTPTPPRHGAEPPGDLAPGDQ